MKNIVLLLGIILLSLGAFSQTLRYENLYGRQNILLYSGEDTLELLSPGSRIKNSISYSKFWEHPGMRYERYLRIGFSQDTEGGDYCFKSGFIGRKISMNRYQVSLGVSTPGRFEGYSSVYGYARADMGVFYENNSLEERFAGDTLFYERSSPGASASMELMLFQNIETTPVLNRLYISIRGDVYFKREDQLGNPMHWISYGGLAELDLVRLFNFTKTYLALNVGALLEDNQQLVVGMNPYLTAGLSWNSSEMGTQMLKVSYAHRLDLQQVGFPGGVSVGFSYDF